MNKSIASKNKVQIISKLNRSTQLNKRSILTVAYTWSRNKAENGDNACLHDPENMHGNVICKKALNLQKRHAKILRLMAPDRTGVTKGYVLISLLLSENEVERESESELNLFVS
ncbi:hypothetical protein Adt_34731 [Abeliophyllum distichum]|uniref:Uncharacterized protein n=1 Tax=Abeliophyllum distichum TaxID=126358 RepID=A0ABD1QZY5_9LAMI